MHTARIAIIGAGLSGLYAAYLLEQQGITDCVLLEARDSVGGRIDSAPALGLGAVGAMGASHGEPLQKNERNEGNEGGEATSKAVAQSAQRDARHSTKIDRVDLGPTWFWPGYQHQLARLVDALGLESFAQHETGDTLVERSRNAPATRVRGYANSPPSMRLVGGMGALTDALHHRLTATRVHTGHAVRRLRIAEQQVEVDTETAQGHASTWHANHVLLALPPRLLASSIDFVPALPPALAQQWHNTDTWMAPHAKYVAVYNAAFWREQGLSGDVRSALGPLGEIHDASMPGGSAALFGFFGVPAQVRQSVSDADLRAHCRAQLVRLFGNQAATPTAEFIKDWAFDPQTATAADLQGSGQHPQAPATAATSGPWSGRFTGIGSEWSPQFPGYIAGAVEAAALGVAAWRAAVPQ